MYTLNLFLLVYLHRWSCYGLYCTHNWFSALTGFGYGTSLVNYITY